MKKNLFNKKSVKFACQRDGFYISSGFGISNKSKLKFSIQTKPSKELIDAINYCEEVRAGKIKTKSYASLNEILKEAGI